MNTESKNDIPVISAELRVVSEAIKPYNYAILPREELSEVIEIKAVGEWEAMLENGNGPEKSLIHYSFPVSLHITVYPGCGVIPCTGDNLKITITR